MATVRFERVQRFTSAKKYFGVRGTLNTKMHNQFTEPDLAIYNALTALCSSSGGPLCLHFDTFQLKTQ